MFSKKKAAAKGEENEGREEIGPDYSAQVSRILLVMRQRSPLSRSDVADLLQDTGADVEAVWNQLKKSIYTREEDGDRLYFEHVLQNVKSSNLLDFIEERRAGVSREELLEFTPELSSAVYELLRSASVLPLLGWRDSNRKTLMMYPRGTDFKVPLSGTVSVKPDSRFLETSVDLRAEIRRGDAIILDGKTYRVSADPCTLQKLTFKQLKELIEDDLGGDCGDIEERDVLEEKAYALMNERGPGQTNRRPSRKLAMESTDALEKFNEFSSSSFKDPVESSKRPSKFKFEFDATRLPLDRVYKGTAALTNITALKHGCTNDVRQVYWQVADTSSNNFTPDNATRLDMQLRERRLISDELLDGINRGTRERNEAQLKRMAQASNGRPAKRQRHSTVVRRITNTHMQKPQ